jgi:hypothetical protein
MVEQMAGEYRVQSLGSTLREPKDAEVNALLNDWSLEGWELVSALHTTSNKIMVIARRPQSHADRRRRLYPT